MPLVTYILSRQHKIKTQYFRLQFIQHVNISIHTITKSTCWVRADIVLCIIDHLGETADWNLQRVGQSRNWGLHLAECRLALARDGVGMTEGGREGVTEGVS